MVTAYTKAELQAIIRKLEAKNEAARIMLAALKLVAGSAGLESTLTSSKLAVVINAIEQAKAAGITAEPLHHRASLQWGRTVTHHLTHKPSAPWHWDGQDPLDKPVVAQSHKPSGITPLTRHSHLICWECQGENPKADMVAVNHPSGMEVFNCSACAANPHHPTPEGWDIDGLGR